MKRGSAKRGKYKRGKAKRGKEKWEKKRERGTMEGWEVNKGKAKVG